MYVKYSDVNQEELAKDIEAIKDQIGAPTCEDFAHLKKIESWGRASGFIGYFLVGMLPFIITMKLSAVDSTMLIWTAVVVGAFFISVANVTRWANVAHPILHGAYDKVPCVPKCYTRKGFASTPWRRLLDWQDWIYPKAWDLEHNKMHHYHLGEADDPDNVERNMHWLTESKVPMFLRYFIVYAFMLVWKPAYYAPNTLKILGNLKKRKAGLAEKKSYLNVESFDPRTEDGRDLWSKFYLPYILFRFVAVPALFLPLGVEFAFYVLIGSLLAELMTNFHSFLMIVPNHSASDIYQFSEPHKSQGEFYLRQIMGSVNYNTGNDMIDFMQGWLNYQIEHHLFPNLPLSQYQKMQPLVKEVCKKHGLEYRQESVFIRLYKTVELMVGKTKLLRVDHI